LHTADTLIRSHPLALFSAEGSGQSQPQASAAEQAARRPEGEAHEREQMLDRLSSLRRALPALAQEMAAARRQAARLRSDNRRLSEQVRQLRKALQAHEGKQS
jgi:septal ring factor EnvC (AmiA/AmiB activator)